MVAYIVAMAKAKLSKESPTAESQPSLSQALGARGLACQVDTTHHEPASKTRIKFGSALGWLSAHNYDNKHEACQRDGLVCVAMGEKAHWWLAI